MNRFSAVLVLACSALCVAQAPPQIKSGATVHIEPMDGYETYLAAAFMKKHVPLVVVADKDKAEYIITSTVAHKDLKGSQSSVVVNTSDTTAFNLGMEQAQANAAAKRALGETSASISVIDAQSSQIVSAYAAGKVGKNQLQKTAEDCAEHLKKSIEKPRK